MQTSNRRVLLRDQADLGRLAATFSSFVGCLFDFVNSRKRAKKEVKVLSTLSRFVALFSHTQARRRTSFDTSHRGRKTISSSSSWNTVSMDPSRSIWSMFPLFPFSMGCRKASTRKTSPCCSGRSATRFVGCISAASLIWT